MRFFARSVSRRHRRSSILRACESLEPRCLFAIPLPVIPAGTFLVTTYGAVGNGTTDNTADIQAAINAASSAGGGTVEFPAAASPYECGPITMASNINFQVDSRAELQALPYGTYPGSGTTSVSNFITCKNLTNFEFSGSGTVDGNGSPWWTAYDANNTIGRARLLNITGSSTILIQNLHLQNSPEFHIAFGTTNNVTINGIVINTSASSPNTDGIDPAGDNYLIENCNISDGDDDIAVKPQSTACANITIQNCTFGSGHGLSVGGETNDGLNGLYVNNCTFTGTTNGIRLKADRTNGGVVENLYYSNITMTNVQYPILIDSYYNGGNNLPTSPSSVTSQAYVAGMTPLWENIIFANMTSTNSASNSLAGVIYGLPEALVTNLDFVNVKLTAKTGLQINYASNIRFDANCHITVSSGSDLYGSTSGSPTYPNPYDATVVAAGFTNADIGSPTVAAGTSSALFDPDSTQWTIMGDGAGITGASDQFNSTFGSIIGDLILTAQLKSLAAVTGAAPQAGVMFRNSSAVGDAFAAVLQSSTQIVFEYRTASGGAITVATPISATVGSDYLRITRAGSSFSGFYSTNGTTWTQIGSTVSLTAINNTAFGGLAATAGLNGSLSTAVFANVSALTGPSIATAASASPNPVTGSTTNLSVLGSEAGSDSGFIYFWQATGPAPVFYSALDSNAAKNNTATFAAAGSYNFSVLIVDPLGLSASSAVAVPVNQTLRSIAVSPATFTVADGQTKSFTASGLDQFAHAMSSQPTFSWTVDSGSAGSINSAGAYSAPFAGPGSATVRATAGSTSGTAAVTVQLTTIAGTSGNDTIRLARSGSSLNVYINNPSTPTYSAAFSSLGALTIVGEGGTDSIILDASSGSSPVPAAGITFAAAGGSATLGFLGSSAGDAIAIASGSVSLPAPSSGAGIVPITLGTLSISSGARFVLDTAAAHTDRTVLVLSSLTNSGLMDLGGNDLIVHGGSLTAVTSLIGEGYNGGPWNGGSGITSSAAAGTDNTALGIELNSNGTTTLMTAFDSVAVNTSDVLVKYTYFGDADLNGVVNGSDYTLIDNGLNNGLTGWRNGDFNYDGVVNGDDYTLIDAAFNSQGPALTASSASQISRPASTNSTAKMARSEPSPIAAASPPPSVNANVFSTIQPAWKIDDLLDAWFAQA